MTPNCPQCHMPMAENSTGDRFECGRCSRYVPILKGEGETELPQADVSKTLAATFALLSSVMKQTNPLEWIDLFTDVMNDWQTNSPTQLREELKAGPALHKAIKREEVGPN